MKLLKNLLGQTIIGLLSTILIVTVYSLIMSLLWSLIMLGWFNVLMALIILFIAGIFFTGLGLLILWLFDKSLEWIDESKKK